MSSHSDDFEDEPEATIDELSQHGMALHEPIQDYGLSDLTTSSVKMHMVGYALETEKPSASGLKLDLGRFRRDMNNLIGGAKKNAGHFITEAKTVRAAAENESEDRLNDERGAP
jgi:hypothetical protein